MRLLFVTKSLTFLGGGAERILADVTGALAERGHEVMIATFDALGAESFYPLSDRVAFHRLGVGDIKIPTGIVTLGRRAWALRRFTRTARPDLAIGFLHSSYVPLAVALANSKAPVIASEHIVFEHYRDLPVQRVALRTIVPLVCAMTAVSESMRSTFPRAMQRKMRVIPNPISQAREYADVIGGRRKTLLSVGRLEKQKDQATLVSAFGLIADQFPEWTLRIAGEGALRANLERQVRSLGLGSRVELPGAVRNIGREYAAAQLFVLPSLYESFGLATAEALSHGLPAVGFAECPGTNDLIEDGVNGLLARGVGSPQPLAQALAQLMSSPDLRVRMTRTGPPSVAHFSLEAIADRWEELLRENSRRRDLDRRAPEARPIRPGS